MTLENMSATAKHVIDALAIGSWIAAVVQWAPSATAVLAFVWAVMRIYQTWQEIRLNDRKMRGD